MINDKDKFKNAFDFHINLFLRSNWYKKYNRINYQYVRDDILPNLCSFFLLDDIKERFEDNFRDLLVEKRNSSDRHLTVDEAYNFFKKSEPFFEEELIAENTRKEEALFTERFHNSEIEINDIKEWFKLTKKYEFNQIPLSKMEIIVSDLLKLIDDWYKFKRTNYYRIGWDSSTNRYDLNNSIEKILRKGNIDDKIITIIFKFIDDNCYKWRNYNADFDYKVYKWITQKDLIKILKRFLEDLIK